MWQSALQLAKDASNAEKDETSADAVPSEIDSLFLNPTPASSQPEFISAALPPPPEFVVGREDIIRAIVHDVVSSSVSRIAILGEDGFGKSTIAAAVLHDPQVSIAFPTRYFVTCEITATTELLEDRIADALSILRPVRRFNGTTLASQIVNSIRHNPDPVLLCIDDLEKLWEHDTENQKLVHFLEQLSELGPKVAIVVTMRGTKEPKTSFPWNCAIISELSTNHSISMYETLSGTTANAATRGLLSKLSGCPLAIKLLAFMVKEGNTPSQLPSSWPKDNPKTLEINLKHDLPSLEQILHLSVFNHRISDTARLILGLIALMPHGLSTSQPWLKSFESTVSAGTDLRLEIRALERAALLKKGGMSRVQMVPPIRQFCLRFVVPGSLFISALIQWYIHQVLEHWDIGDSISQSVIPPEMPNIRSLLLYGSHLQPLPQGIGRAGADYINWACWQHTDESAFLCSFLDLPTPIINKAEMHYSLGKVHKRFNRPEAALVSFSRSVELFTEAEDQERVAKVHRYIAEVHLLQSHLDNAEASFNLALKVYAKLRDRIGEAGVHVSLGNLDQRRNRLDAAEVSFTRALKLYGQARDSSREAKTYYALGELHDRQGRLDEAEISFTQALKRYSECQDFYGKAHSQRSIGHIYVRQGQLNAAETSYICALEFYIKAQDRWDEAATRLSIGDLQIRRKQPNEAESSFSCALKIYGEVQDQLGEANAHWSIGDLHKDRYRYDAAKASFTSALDLYSKVSSGVGEAKTHKSIGGLQMWQEQLDAAEQSFARALQLYREIPSQMGEAHTVICIGDLHLQRDRLHSAEASFTHALALYRQLSYSLGEASSCHSQGCLYLRRDQLVEAETSLTRALELYLKSNERGQEANIELTIGELHLRRNDVDAAEVSFTRSLTYYADHEDRWMIADCTLGLGLVCFRKQDIDGAGTAFSRALVIWEGIDDQWGIARAHQALGDFHLRKMHLDDAEMCLNRALDLYTTKVEARRFEALTNCTLGELRVQRGQFDDGERAFRRALDLYITSGSRLGQAESHRGLGRLFMSKEDPSSAESSYADALRLFFEINDYQTTSCLEELGKVWMKQGRMEENESSDVEALRACWDAKERAELSKDNLLIDS
ncbi:hypothetical protein DL96DRAFT_602594 [Flagelloscypha sp. PMI_526]|nr:hypothetical protein DL96DRAFT_602594 [Flagelloscypha sp. PMI_526]